MYGKELLTQLPEDCTALLKRLCTNYHPNDGAGASMLLGARACVYLGIRGPMVVVVGAAEGPGHKANPERFIAIFVNQPLYLRQFLQFMIKVSRWR